MVLFLSKAAAGTLSSKHSVESFVVGCWSSYRISDGRIHFPHFHHSLPLLFRDLPFVVGERELLEVVLVAAAAVEMRDLDSVAPNIYGWVGALVVAAADVVVGPPVVALDEAGTHCPHRQHPCRSKEGCPPRSPSCLRWTKLFLLCFCFHQIKRNAQPSCIPVFFVYNPILGSCPLGNGQ